MRPYFRGYVRGVGWLVITAKTNQLTWVWELSDQDSYCWWKKSCTSWLVVYPSIYRFFTSQEMVSMTHHGSGRLPRLFTMASTVCPPPPYAAPFRWTVNHYKDAPGIKDMDGKWVIVPILINGTYCGYNRLTHLLLTSWDILVELAILVGVSIYTIYIYPGSPTTKQLAHW